MSSKSNASGGFLVLMAFIALALTLRSPLTAIPPIINELRQGFAISPAMAGLLTSIPVLCFGALTPLASLIIARTSIETSIFLTLLGSALGMIIRSAGGIEVALVGTVLLGTALTVGNIVSLMIIARDFSGRARLVTAIYTAALNFGTMLTSATTAPLAILLGWRVALASVVALVVPTILLWLLVLLRRNKALAVGKAAERTDSPAATASPVWRRKPVWMLVFSLGAHLFIYYGMTAWLPAYLMESTGMTAPTAGLVASLFQILALLGSFGVPLMAGRIAVPWLLVGMAGCWTVTPLGLILAPQAWLVWAIICGIATGGGFTVIFMLIMSFSRDLTDNRKISSLVQGGGYTVSSVGPMVVGSLHQSFGGWSWGFLLLAGVGVVMMSVGYGLVRNR